MRDLHLPRGSLAVRRLPEDLQKRGSAGRTGRHRKGNLAAKAQSRAASNSLQPTLLDHRSVLNVLNFPVSPKPPVSCYRYDIHYLRRCPERESREPFTWSSRRMLILTGPWTPRYVASAGQSLRFSMPRAHRSHILVDHHSLNLAPLGRVVTRSVTNASPKLLSSIANAPSTEPLSLSMTSPQQIQ